MGTAPDVNIEALSKLMQLEASARRAQSEKALEFLIVNETKQLVDYQQGVLVHNMRNGLRVSSASNIAVIEDQAPCVGELIGGFNVEVAPCDAFGKQRQRVFASS